jgi:hypothetical protein
MQLPATSKIIHVMPRLAPIAVFIYNRPDRLREMLTGLMQCEGFNESPVIVFADGPKRPDQTEQVQAARAVAKEMLGDRAIYHFSDVNRGLARSLISGVTEITADYGRVIVVEDDLMLAPGFLSFVNAALDRYADVETVYQISGHAFEVSEFAERRRAMLLPMATTWGWGTWARAWQQFDEAATGCEQLETDPSLRRSFNLNGVYDYTTMIKRQKLGRGNSWGVLWHWSVFRNNGLTLFPPRTLVYNIGMDAAGTNGSGMFRRFDKSNDPRGKTFPGGPFELPDPVMDKDAYATVCRTIWYLNGGRVGQFVDFAKRLALALPTR